ncbi:hypothetical protein ACLKA7_014549 [Drosophila subpalustris]
MPVDEDSTRNLTNITSFRCLEQQNRQQRNDFYQKYRTECDELYDRLTVEKKTLLQLEQMDGGGDNQLTARYNRRPIHRRVEMILQDYQRRWERPRPIYDTRPNTAIPPAIVLANRDLSLNSEADDSGFESGSESDLL